MNRTISSKILAIAAIALAVFAVAYALLATQRWTARVRSLERKIDAVQDLGAEVIVHRQKISMILYRLNPSLPQHKTSQTLPSLYPRNQLPVDPQAVPLVLVPRINSGLLDVDVPERPFDVEVAGGDSDH